MCVRLTLQALRLTGQRYLSGLQRTCLLQVAGVPGMVGAMFRHLHSLRQFRYPPARVAATAHCMSGKHAQPSDAEVAASTCIGGLSVHHVDLRCHTMTRCQPCALRQAAIMHKLHTVCPCMKDDCDPVTCVLCMAPTMLTS